MLIYTAYIFAHLSLVNENHLHIAFKLAWFESVSTLCHWITVFKYFQILQEIHTKKGFFLKIYFLAIGAILVIE